jgi:uncharacterized protein (TIGR03083 family)
MFGPERRALLTLLNGLDDAGWERPTICPGWSVRDIATHLLGDDLSRLARSRDDHHGLAMRPGEDLPMFLHRINDEWVTAARRLSPVLLTGMLEWSGEQVARFWAQQDLQRIGEPVSWAGPDPAPVWLDAARDFTEYWVHRHQIRDALGLPDDSPSQVRHLVLDTFVRALPHALREQVAPAGTAVTVTVDGPGGGRWSAVSSGRDWAVAPEPLPDTSAEVVLDGDIAWRLWTRGVDPQDARHRITVHGDPDLAGAVLHMVSIIR